MNIDISVYNEGIVVIDVFKELIACEYFASIRDKSS